MNLSQRLASLERAAMRFASGSFLLAGSACLVYAGILLACLPGAVPVLLWSTEGGLLLWMSQRVKVRGGFLIEAVNLQGRARAVGAGLVSAGAGLLMFGGFIFGHHPSLAGLLALAVAAPLGHILWLLSEEALFAH